MDAPRPPRDRPHEPLSVTEVRYWAEFICWTMVVLAPLLTWLNGPAVSTDQFVVRTATFCLALIGGVSLRTCQILRGSQKRCDQNEFET